MVFDGVNYSSGGFSFAWWFENKYPLTDIEDDKEDEDSDDKDGENDEDRINADGDVFATEEGASIPNNEGKVIADESALANNDVEETIFRLGNAEDGENSTENDDIGPKTLLIARFTYPLSLGTIEAVATVILKAASSMATIIVTNNNSEDDTSAGRALWIVLIIVGVILFLGIVLWLRLVYSRFEISGAFPVEFGMLTFASVLGAFLVYQDYNFITDAITWVGVGVACASILGGILIVAIASWKASLRN